MTRHQRGERVESELEAVRLRLIATEQQDRPACRRPLGRGKTTDVDRVVEHLPGSGR